MSDFEEKYIASSIEDPQTAASLFRGIRESQPKATRVGAVAVAVLFVDDSGLGYWLVTEAVAVGLRNVSRSTLVSDAGKAFEARARILDEAAQGRAKN